MEHWKKARIYRCNFEALAKNPTAQVNCHSQAVLFARYNDSVLGNYQEQNTT